MMLQQTQVERVVPRWHAWLARTGALRPRRDDLSRAGPALRRLPARPRVPVPRTALRAAAQAVAVRGLVPPAARYGAARRRRRPPVGRPRGARRTRARRPR